MKRVAQVKSYIPPEMKAQLELFKAERGVVVSMSDYLFEVIEEHIAMQSYRRRPGIRASHQKYRRRAEEA